MEIVYLECPLCTYPSRLFKYSRNLRKPLKNIHGKSGKEKLDKLCAKAGRVPIPPSLSINESTAEHDDNSVFQGGVTTPMMVDSSVIEGDVFAQIRFEKIQSNKVQSRHVKSEKSSEAKLLSQFKLPLPAKTKKKKREQKLRNENEKENLQKKQNCDRGGKYF